MSTVAKFFVVLNLLLAVAFLGAAATFLGYVDSYRNKYTTESDAHKATQQAKDAMKIALEAERDEAKNAKNLADSARNASEARLNQAQTAYAAQKEAYDVLNSSLQKATAALVVAQKTISDNRDFIKVLQDEHTSLVAANQAANDAKQAAIKAQHALELNMENAQIQIQDLQAKLSSTQNDLQRATFRLESIISRYPGVDQGGEQPYQEGKILAVDNAANVVVISLGSEDGVKAGFRYVVSSGSNYVATIEITDTESKKSAGRALKDLSKGQIKVGNDVMTAR